MVVDGQALEHLLHVDSLEHVVESTSLALLRAALERNARQIWTIPRKIRVERQSVFKISYSIEPGWIKSRLREEKIN